jgi:cytoskeletal protein CcmA (bactofilin family)
MWRRQEQPKSSSPATDPATEVGAGPAVEMSRPTSSTPSKPAQDAPAVGSRLTRALTIKGEITGREDLLIDAQLDGHVHLDGATVTVGPNGRVNANIEAGEIVVHGGVTGGLQGRERVRIGPTGRATGDIITRRIFIEGGAEIHGMVEVTRVDESPASHAVAPTSAQVTVPHPAQSVQSPAKEPSAAA